MIFDVLPKELRDNASIAIKIGTQTIVAQFGRFTEDQTVAKRQAHLMATSQRYPVSVHLELQSDTLSNWNYGLARETQAALLAMAALFGLLIARGMLPRPTQLDALDRALACGEIVPYFQPIVSLTDSTIVGCEMLARWIKPDGTVISPGVFIPLAEANGRADKIMEVLLSETGSSISETISRNPDFKFTFNVTPEQFRSPNFA